MRKLNYVPAANLTELKVLSDVFQIRNKYGQLFGTDYRNLEHEVYLKKKTRSNERYTEELWKIFLWQ